jgi:hypothetical protein
MLSFPEDLPDTVSWPGEAAKRLAALIHDFNTRDFTSLPQELSGQSLSGSSHQRNRHLQGNTYQ